MAGILYFRSLNPRSWQMKELPPKKGERSVPRSVKSSDATVRSRPGKTVSLMLFSALLGALIVSLPQLLPPLICRHHELLAKVPLSLAIIRTLAVKCPPADATVSNAVSREERLKKVDSRPPSREYAGKLVVLAAGHCIKKDTSKSAHACGEDAFAVDLSPTAPKTGRSFFGVADGVGGWGEAGGDSSKISNGFLQEMTELTKSTELSLSNISQRAFAKLDSLKSHKQGSTTLCTAIFNHQEGKLYISNVGDSGAFILRNGEIIFKTKLGVEGFNAPHQVGFDQLGRPYGSIQLMETRHSTPLLPGDIVIMVTDGVLDNLYDQEIAEIVAAMVGPIASGAAHGRVSPSVQLDAALQERIKSAATTLAWHSWARSQEAHWRSPFADSAISHGYVFSGGKQDDITAVIAVVREA